MMGRRVYPSRAMQDALIDAAMAFEGEIAAKRAEYETALKSPDLRFLETERRVFNELELVI